MASMMSSSEGKMGGPEEKRLHDAAGLPGASSRERRFTYGTFGVVDEELVDGRSTDVETREFDEEGSTEACDGTSKRFSYEDLMDDNR